LVKIQNMLVLRIVTSGFKSSKEISTLVRLGSEYGGWWIPKSILEKDSIKRILISAGLGFDVTFDEALLKSGFEVIGLDPLQESITFANKYLSNYSNFKALNMGLWTSTGIEKFFPPKNIFHDSWSITNIQNTPNYESNEVSTISMMDLIIQYPQIKEAAFVILKMDVEGSELEILKDFKIISCSVNYLAVEFDFLSLIPFRSLKKRIKLIFTARKILRNIRAEGFQLIKNENYNLFWISTIINSKL
jgi:FkbM family methyltransferase